MILVSWVELSICELVYVFVRVEKWEKLDGGLLVMVLDLRFLG